jgi:galactonate dehydratase
VSASRITSATVHRVAVDERTRWVFLELGTDDGLCGLGECLLPDGDDLGVAALERGARPLIGLDVTSAAPPMPDLSAERATGLLEATVHAAVDQCLWDLRARQLGVPVHRLLGPQRRSSVKLYANINRGTRDRRPEGFALRAREALQAGFGAVKIAPFDGFGRRDAHTPAGRDALALAIERTSAVREALGSTPMLMIDCHCRLDLVSARRFLDATRDLRIDWFEDALPYHDLAGWRMLRGVAEAPLAGGETARGISDLLPFIRDGIWDVLMPDVRFFGGITELVSLSSLAAQHQLTIAPHNPRGPVGTLASAHAMAGCPVFGMLEYQFGECAWRGALVGEAEKVSDGHLILPEGPGLGMSLAPAVVAAHRA